MRVRWLLIAALAAGCADTTTVRITITGRGTGSVSIIDPRDATNPPSPLVEHVCTESCELTFPSGFLRLRVDAFYDRSATTAEIAGPDVVEGMFPNSLEVGPLEGDDLEVTVTFTSWEETPLAFATTGVFAPDGDLLVGTHYGVARMSLAGDVAWSTPVTLEQTPSPNVGSLEMTSTGEVFALGRYVYPRKLTKLTADGVVSWSIELSGEVRNMAATPAGDVVVVEDTVRLLRGTDGSEVWSVPLLRTDSVTVGPDGIIYVARKQGYPVVGEIVRFTAAGAPLTPSFSFPVDSRMHAGLAIDEEGALLVTSYVHLRLDATTGAVLSMRPLTEPQEDDVYASERSPGVAVTSSNQAFVWMPRRSVGIHGLPGVAGSDVWTIDASGMETWSAAFEPSSGVVTSGTCDRNKHCAVFGTVPATFFDVP